MCASRKATNSPGAGVGKRFRGVEKQRKTEERDCRCPRPTFRAGKTPKIPFLGLSLLLNPTETLATQARGAGEEGGS